MKEAYLKHYNIYGAFDKDEENYKLYKAYLENDIEEEVKVNMDGDYFSINPEYAVQFLAKETFSKAHRNIEGEKIVILEFDIDSSIRKNVLWVNNSEEEDAKPDEWHGTAFMRLRGLPLHVSHIIRRMLSSCEIEVLKNDEIYSITVTLDTLD